MLSRENAMSQKRFLPWLLIAVWLSLGLVACQMPGAEPEAGAETVEEPETQPETEAVTATSVAEKPAAEEPEELIEEELFPAELLAFAIIGERSQARFIIDETLGGVATRVVGVTSGLSGSLRTSYGRIGDSEFDLIVIDANTFVTPSDRRNGAIRNFVLYTKLYPEITFAPTLIDHAPSSVAVGEEFTLEVTGPLYVLDSDLEVTFLVTAVFNSEKELTGTGTTTIILEDHGINVPRPPLVSWVDDKMILELDFVAAAE